MKRIAYAVVALCVAQGASAAETKDPLGNHMDLYFSSLDFEVESGGDKASIDGGGGGLAFWLGNEIGLFTGEIQSNKLDGNIGGFDADADTRSFRVGLGYRFLNERNAGAWLRAEYVNFDADLEIDDVDGGSDEQDGFGIHAGGMIGTGMFRGYAEIGRVDLDDLDGMEYKVGVSIQPGMVGGFIEYRVTDLELDHVDADEKLEDLRIGLRMGF
ncbi:hypothetical protein DFR24_0657 [Panacagrimonas perspica]|uniref:Outer membrane protein beta-barrel domain-containing protein n=1 Tax=Panacagrimonas perspica TaxID=381431 RepID=A0A4R7PB39_9GAMM|nr:outer membrane beta-barrel protein [Panacagrimonas perspica]TDU31293.1 hypothetical protein DFR24_0657 [Panacagrimonas perspica]THD02637.1 hypothetical protein B1810_13915 [Panacagrimonas perspica]